MRPSVLLLVGLLVASLGRARVLADTPAQAAQANDIKALNYALFLERLELAFYTQGQTRFSRTDFVNFNSAFGSVYDYLGLIRQHEQAHVDALVSTITMLGGTPIAACNSYAFSGSNFPANVSAYLSNAVTAEGTGVMAYDYAIQSISDPSIQEVAATIATIEARHTSYLRVVANQTDTNNPFPAALDTASAPSDIVAAVTSAFLTSGGCTAAQTPDLPIIRPNGVKTDNTLANTQASSSSPNPSNPEYTEAEFDNDLNALLYALTLERLEANFYNTGLGDGVTTAGLFSQSDFESAFPGQGALVFNRLGMIRNHENAHVSALSSTISARGGTLPGDCTYNFTAGAGSVAAFLLVAQLLENTGVSAYDGAVNTIKDTGLQVTAATIATVEARHAAYLNGLEGAAATNANYQSGNFDHALTPAEVLAAVTALNIQNCPGTLTLPTPVAAAYNTTSNSTSGASSSSSSGSFSSSSTGSGGNNAGNIAAPSFGLLVLAALAAALCGSRP